MTFDDLVARQAGVVSLEQAVAHGVSARTVQRRAHDAGWQRLLPSVYLVGGHRLDDEAQVRAAYLWAGPEATLAGPAAAYWHGMLQRAPDVIDLTVPAGRSRRCPSWIRLQRRELSWIDRVQYRDLWLTGEALTALQTAVALPDGSAFLDRALQRHVRFPALYRAYCRNLGRRGWSEAGRLISASADRADSAAERLLVRIVRRAGLTGWELGHPFGRYRIDLAFPAARVAVEVDGWAWHVDPERFRADRRKGNALTGSDWKLLRFTWHDLDRRPAECLAEILAALGLSAISRTGS